jgi:hypothetical protein
LGSSGYVGRAVIALAVLASTVSAPVARADTVTNCVATSEFQPPAQCRPHDDYTESCRTEHDPAAIGYACAPFANGCAGYTMERNLDGYRSLQADLPRGVFGGTEFPRTDRLQYRGIRISMDQFTVPKVLRAIGGDPTPTIGSRLTWQLDSILRDPTKIHLSDALLDRLRRAYRWYVLGIPTMFGNFEQVLADHGILDDVRRLLACRPSYNERDAAVYARDLTAKAFRHLERTWGDTFTRHLFAYETDEFHAYGDYKGGLHLYSSSYPLMAQAYGAKILAFTNHTGKTLDMNYWNYVRNGGRWGYHYADRAEFVTAGAIDPHAVSGIWITDESGRDEMGRDTTMTRRKIQYALMRLRHRGRNYAVILDASTTDCLMRVDAHFEACEDRIPPGWEEKPISAVGEVEFGPLMETGRRLPVIAVVRACDVNLGTCHIPDEIFAEMPLSERELTASELAAIRAATFSRGRRLFAQTVRAASDLRRQRIHGATR